MVNVGSERMIEPIRELIVVGLKTADELFDHLSRYPGFVAQVISEVDESERFAVKNVVSEGKDHVILQGGIEPVLSFIRYYRSSTILSCAFFADCFGRHFSEQILKTVNFGLFDSSLKRVEIADHPRVMDLQWLAGLATRDCIQRLFRGSYFKTVEITGDIDSGEVLLNVGWFLARYCSPFSIEFNDSDCIRIKSAAGPVNVRKSLRECYNIRTTSSECVVIVNDSNITCSDGVELARVKHSVWEYLTMAMIKPYLFKDYIRSLSLLNYLRGAV